MHLPYESLVLITASGGAIIIFFISVAIFCICRHTRRSRKAVIHILANPSQSADVGDSTTDQASWERNQLIPTARSLHALNPKAKICAISTSKSTWCPPAHSCVLEHPSLNNTSSVSPLINHVSINTAITKTLCDEEQSSTSTNHTSSNKPSDFPAACSQLKCDIEKLVWKNVEKCGISNQPATSDCTTIQHAHKSLLTKGCVSVPSAFDKISPVHNVSSPEQSPVKIKKTHSFHEANASEELAKSRKIQASQYKRLDKHSNSHHPQASSSVSKRSNPHKTPESSHSFHQPRNVKDTRNTGNNRLLRSQSFAGRTKINIESRSSKSEQSSSQTRKPKLRRNNSVTSNSRQEQYLESLQIHVRTQRVVSVTHPSHSSVQELAFLPSCEEPSTSMRSTVASNNAEEVLVLDGTEPPPPYYS